jgi:quercetin dioxygenase-like cupin family protein
MRRFVVFCAFISAVLTVSVTSATGEGVPRPLATGAEATEAGRGVAESAGILPVELGDQVAVQKIVVEPGKALAWHQQPENAVVVMTKGTLNNYVSCTDKQTWEAGKSYLLLGSDKNANLTKNEGSAPAEFVAIFGKVPADQAAGSAAFRSTDAPAGCPAAQDGVKVEELARGVAYGAGKYDIRAGTNVVVQKFVLQPGFTTTWHRHPDSQLVIQLKGTAVNYTDCQTKELWTPGNAYIHLPSEHHNAKPMLTRNESSEPIEVLFVFFNVPNDARYPAGVPPLDPGNPPPAECPTMLY